MAYSILKHRRGTTHEWLDINLTPQEGELVIEECDNGALRCKIGNGRDAFLDLDYIDDNVKRLLLDKLAESEAGLKKSLANLDAIHSNNLKANYNSIKETLQTAVDTIQEAFRSYTDTEVAELAKIVDTKITDTSDDILSSIRANKEETDTSILLLKDSIDESHKAAKVYSDKQDVLLGTKLSEELSLAITSLNDKFTAMIKESSLLSEDELRKLTKELNTSINDLELTTTKSLQATKEDLNNTIDALIVNHNNDINELDKKLDNKIAEQAEEISIQTKELKDTILATEKTITSAHTKDISDLKQLLQESLAILSDEKTNEINNTKAIITTLLELQKTKHLEDIELLKNTIENLENTSDEKFALQEKLNSESFDNLKKLISELQEKTENLSADDLQIVEQLYLITNKLNDDLEELTTKVLNIVNTHVSDIEKVSNENKSLREYVTEADLKITDTISDYITDIYNKLKVLVENDLNIVESYSARANTIESKLSILDFDLKQFVEEAKSELSSSIASLTSTSNLKFIELQDEITRVESLINADQNELLSKIEDVSENTDVLRTALNSEVNSINNKINSIDTRVEDNKLAIALQSNRISKIISLEDGSTTGDAELIDIRRGYNGVDHLSAGDAVRAIGSDLDDLKRSLPDYIPSNAVDGLIYEDNLLYLSSNGVPVSEPVEITGGSGGTGGSISTVRIENLLDSNTFTVAKDREALIRFKYTSYEGEIPTGAGTLNLTINNVKIADYYGVSIAHGNENNIDLKNYLKNGTNTVRVTCVDQYGASRTLVYTISVIDLKITSTFDSTLINTDKFVFRYTVVGSVEKTVHIELDGKEILTRVLSASASNIESTYTIPKQEHGSHLISAYVTAMIGDTEITSNIINYEVICIESNNNHAVLASVFDTEEVTQGDLVSIPFMVYDPSKIACSVALNIYSQVAGKSIKYSSTELTVDRTLQHWQTRKYPAGTSIFEIVYTYELFGNTYTLTKTHTVSVKALDIDLEATTDSLQLHLSAQGRLNSEANPAIWEYTQEVFEGEIPKTITTTFENFNWKSNGWLVDENGDTCLRLNGDARAIINFKPFEKDFKLTGKTIEFEFKVRDVNSRDTVVIDCFEGGRGFQATPDTAYLQSSGTKVSCRYKDEEKIRIAITVDYSKSLSKFVCIYLDGVLSGVQRYADTDVFAQENAVKITLGSNLCGLDLYSVRIYDKALETRQVLYNYIADITEPTEKQQLITNNNILDENGKISYEKVKALGQIPIITFIGKMPEYKGDKQKKSVRMIFEDPVNQALNFDEILDQIDVQGTSSQFYVRKNWKTKHENARQHIPGAIPAKVFCIKVDYAEATGTHNTGVANYVETFYDRNTITLPPQKDDPRVRTTIQGFPCIIFEKTTEDAEPVFSSKGNFNYDKDAEDVFGFNKTYESYGVECWEFCNNTSDAVNFVGEVPNEWIDDFEPRYVPESANFERIEELLELKEDAANGKATITDTELTELASLQQRCIANFKKMHDWVLSTATYTLEEGRRVPIVPVPLTSPVVYGTTTYTEDNEEYRLAKFKYEFENYFNMHYSCIYYVFTLFALMTDQRAKNMFLTRWKEDDGVYRWYPYFYDNDTIFGINNEGALVFDYYHEDIDQLGSSNVYNGQNSVLWNNFRICFPQKIQETYATLRSSKKLTYDAIVEQFITKGSDKWSAAIYNEDAEYKYVSMARVESTQTDENGNEFVGVDASNLYQVRGPGEHHLRYFIDNRLNYCDSKFYAGNYPSDDIFLRIYTPKAAEITEDMSDEEKEQTIASNERILASLEAVPANPSITVTPFSNIYAGVRYKSGTLQQKRLAAGESYTFGPIDPNETFGDTETAIYGASELSSLGDLSGLYCGVISLGNASKLTEIVVGNPSPNYHNDNFREISVGTNRLLKTIDLRNCSGLGIAGANPQKTLELTGCPNIENIYTEGTNLSAVALPDSGYIKVLHLPESINTLKVQNQLYIEDFSIAGYSNIRLLNIENCPTLDTNRILESCRDKDGNYTVERVRLSGINWQLDDKSFIESLYPRFDEEGKFIGGIRGIDADNNLEDEAYLAGTCHIKELTGTDFATIKSHYPYLEIGYDNLTSHITFMNETGDEPIHESDVTGYNSIAPNYPDPVLSGHIPTPFKESTPEFEYKWIGWSREPNNELHKDALLNIESDRTLYPVFEAIRRSYEVKFINPTDNNKELYSVMVLYGEDAIYKGEIAIEELLKGDTDSPDDFVFSSWYPSTENITGPRICYAQFAVDKDSWHELTLEDISNCEDKEGNLFDGYKLNTSSNTMTITKNKNNFNTAVLVNNTLEIPEQGTFTITELGGFSSNEKLTVIDLPDSLLKVSDDAFNSCYKLEEVYMPDSLTSIGLRAFKSCSKLSSIKITKNIKSIGQEAFTLSGLKTIEIDPLNTKYILIDNCLIDTYNNILLFGGLPKASIPQNSLITSLAPYCFHSTDLISAYIPEGISTIPSNAFSRCYSLTEVNLPSTIKTLDATCFGWCYDLAEITLPEGITNINTWVFYGCGFENLVIPASANSILDRSFGSLNKLKTVTFKKRLDTKGNVVIPSINEAAFAGSGSSEGLVINIPWHVEDTPLAPWGAVNCTINHYENEEDLEDNA